MTPEERRSRRQSAVLSLGLSAALCVVALLTVRPWGAVLPVVLLMLAANALNLWAAWRL